MDKNQTLGLVAIIFGIIALVHLMRSIFRWDVVVENFNIPLYFSYIVVIIFGYLAWRTFIISRK